MNLISSLRRTQRKNKIINTILSSPQKNNAILSIYRKDINNSGDLYSAPHHYFSELKNSSVDIFDYKREEMEIQKSFIKNICSNSLIVGGGGLLNHYGFSKQMKMFEQLATKNKKVVLWGIGHNAKHFKNRRIRKYNIDISKFPLVGTRDYSMPGTWVPCASCLNPLLDKDYPEIREMGIVFHKNTLRKPAILKKFSGIPFISNSYSIESLIKFIGSSESVITDSYHAMYWGLILNKKVVAIANSTKFFDFKYQPVISSYSHSTEDLKKAIRYSGIKDECREINKKFSQQVFNYLNLE